MFSVARTPTSRVQLVNVARLRGCVDTHLSRRILSALPSKDQGWGDGIRTRISARDR